MLETYDEKLFAMITGKVSDEYGKPLKDVKVTIKGIKGMAA
jgi:protocatechuate 3,4-dioxygenase beta subunit